jgi:hypothetical protein
LNLRTIIGLSLACCLWLSASALNASPNSGKISGVVLDPSGTAQMGATVLISSEQLFDASQIELLTNDHGHFSTSSLPAGRYTVKVTLAGFLPAMEQNIKVSDQRTTLLQVMLGSVFSSFGKLRQQPNQQVGKDDWSWVLRTSAATRSVMQYQDPQVMVVGQSSSETSQSQDDGARGRLVLVSGGDHPGSVGALADSPGTAFVYDLGLGNSAQLLMAGQFSTERGASAASFAGEWLPSGKVGVGPVTTLVVRQSQLGPIGPTFRGLRVSHDDQLAVSDRVTLRYGSELLVTSLMNQTTTAVRPRGEVDVKLGRGWQASTIVATQPWNGRDAGTPTGMDSALNALDGFPTVLIRHARPLTEDDLHEEFAVDHAVGHNGHLSGALFHDSSNHTAVIGRGGAADGPDFLQDYFSQAFAYDGGHSSSMGARAAYTEKVSNSTDIGLIYAYGGVLAAVDSAAGKTLRSQLATESRHSVAGRTSTRIPHVGTNIVAAYKWVSGQAVSRLDAYGESFYGIDPYLSLQIKQPIPALFSGHIEVEADAGNLLGQGYVPVSTNRGQVVLVSGYRYFRGGLSFQF